MKKVVFLLSVLTLVGCKSAVAPCTKEVAADKLAAVDQTQLQKDIVTIDAYLASKSIVATQDPTGLRYVITKAGDSATPCLETFVTVKYAGRLLNGTGFDAAVNPISFQLKGLILGWQIGFLKFGRGTKATLYIPSGLAYGTVSQTKIPANSNLIFDVEVITY